MSLKVLLMKTDDGYSDSRGEKEVYSLGKKHDISIFGWDREHTYSGIKTTTVEIDSKEFPCHYVGIKAPFGVGIKKLLPYMLRFWFREWRFLLRESPKYDVLHVCDLDAAIPLFFMRKGPKIVYDIYDYRADSYDIVTAVNTLIKKMETRMINRSDAVIICSEKRREQILPARPENLIVIHNAPPMINTQESGTNGDAETERIKLVYVGVLSEERYLREIAEVMEDRPDIEWHIAGYGPLEPFFEEEASKCSNIVFHGKMRYNEVLLLEGKCNIMTAIYDPSVRSHKYAAPNKFYEALMLKKPIIMLRDTGMDHYVEEYQLGEVINGGKAEFKEQFSRALDNLAKKREEWPAMGERGYKLYENEFSWSKMEDRLLKMYEGLA